MLFAPLCALPCFNYYSAASSLASSLRITKWLLACCTRLSPLLEFYYSCGSKGSTPPWCGSLARCPCWNRSSRLLSVELSSASLIFASCVSVCFLISAGVTSEMGAGVFICWGADCCCWPKDDTFSATCSYEYACICGCRLFSFGESGPTSASTIASYVAGYK